MIHFGIKNPPYFIPIAENILDGEISVIPKKISSIPATFFKTGITLEFINRDPFEKVPPKSPANPPKIIKIKLQIEAGKATPAPPIGTSLGPTGINMGEFCSQFNEQTKEMSGDIIPAVISIFEDRSFSFVLRTPPASFLLKQKASIKKGSGKNLVKKIGSVSKQDIQDIAKLKLEELNARDISQAEKIIEGTAKSMGITIK